MRDGRTAVDMACSAHRRVPKNMMKREAPSAGYIRDVGHDTAAEKGQLCGWSPMVAMVDVFFLASTQMILGASSQYMVERRIWLRPFG